MNEITKIIQKKLTSEEKSQQISRILELSKTNKLTKEQLESLLIEVYFNSEKKPYEDDLTESNFDNTFLKLLLEFLLENHEIDIDFIQNLLMIFKFQIETKNNIKKKKKLLDCLRMIENKKQLEDISISFFIPHLLKESEIDIFTGDENSLLNLIVKYLKEKHPKILNDVLDKILLIINNSTTISDSDKKLRKEIIEKYKIPSSD
jgi:hypothetical protein